MTEKVYYHCLISPEETSTFEKGGLKKESATVKDAYFGRHPTPGPFTLKCPLGLNIWIDYDSGSTSGATYTKLEDIEGLMDDLGAKRTEELIGKRVLAHTKKQRLVGLSA